MNTDQTNRTVPPFPHVEYDFPIDKLRHWIELQGDREFTVHEAGAATGLEIRNFIGRLAARDEVEFVADTGRYRRGPGLWLVDFDRMEENARKLNQRLRILFEISIGNPLRLIAERLRVESQKQPGTNPELLLCADELEHLLDRVFGDEK